MILHIYFNDFVIDQVTSTNYNKYINVGLKHIIFSTTLTSCTSPKAPRPIHFTISKSSTFIRLSVTKFAWFSSAKTNKENYRSHWILCWFKKIYHLKRGQTKQQTIKVMIIWIISNIVVQLLISKNK